MQTIATWQTLIGTLLGAAIAFGGIWWNSRSSFKQLKHQLEHVEKLQRQQVFRERLEELYGLIGKLDGYVFVEILHAGMLAEGIMSEEEYLQRYPTTEVETPVDHTRLEMLVGIYGKKFRSTYETANNARNGVIALKGEFERLYLKELPTQEIYNSLIKAHDEFQEAVKALKAEIAESVLA